MNFEQNGDDLSLTARFAKQAQDFDDLQDEMSGRDVGRISRFLTGDAHDPKMIEKRRARWNETLTKLQIMMSDREYAQLYRDTQKHLRGAQSGLGAALEKVLNIKAEVEARLQDTLDGSAQLADGRRVFKDQNGQVVFENGDLVDDDLSATVVWNGSEPSYEDMQAQKDRLNGLAELEADIYAGQAEIGDMEDRMADENDPVTKDQMPEFQDRADEIEADISQRLEAELNRKGPSAETPELAVENVANLEVPKL